MSVIVKNMEMPKNCKDCPFSDHEAWCLIPGSWRERYYCPDDERSADCPLIELPPHGRLTAKKTITEIRYHDADGYHIVNGEQLCELEIDAETIIEAEGETDA